MSTDLAMDFGLATQDLDAMNFLDEFQPFSDSFLTSYLHQLETNASLQAGSASNGFPSNVTSSMLSASEPLQQNDDLAFMNPAYPMDGSGSGDAVTLSAVPISAAATPAPMRVYSQHQQTLDAPFAQSAGVSGNTSGSHDRAHGISSAVSWDQPQHMSDAQDNTDAHTSGRRRREGKRVRTHIQQQQNKLAQQRYREKRKQKNSELESKVEQLVSQLNSLHEVQGQAAQLSGENAALRSTVSKQQQIIEDLRLEMKSMALVAENGCSGVPGCEEATASCSTGASDPTKCARQVELSRRMKAITPEEALAQFGSLVRCIQTSLAEKGLPTDAYMHGDPRYNDSTLKTELSRLVGETCLNCMHLFLSRTICPVEKCDTTNPERFTMVPDCAGTKAKWTACLDSVNLTTAQEDVLLQQRQELLTALRRVYFERNRLNLMAIGMMLPSPSQVLSPCFDPAPDAKIKCMEVNGALYCMRNEKELNDVLDNLKLNLKAEQKLLMEINYKFVHKVLEPAQAAVLMVAAYPSNVDILALANLLAYRRNQNADGLVPRDGLKDAVPQLSSPFAPTAVAAQ